MALEQQNSAIFDMDKLDLFPAQPGVYLMKDVGGKILYIGKAKNIRIRLRTYFSRTGDGRPSAKVFLPRVAQIETLITNNEKEAFLLENVLIKKNKPPYNIRLRDDKTYISLRINLKNTYPRLEWVRRRKNDGSLYFGPYSSASAARNTVHLLEKIFPLRTCTDTVMRNRTRPCIRYQIKRCLAPCKLHVPADEYNQIVNGAILYLRGDVKELKERLRGEMAEHAAGMRYERAAEARNRLSAIEATMEKQAIAGERIRDMDIIAHHIAGGMCCIAVFQYRLGVLTGTRTFTFNLQERTPAEIYYSFIGQYYGEDSFIPSRILVGEEPEDKDLLEESLTDIKKSNVSIILPQRGHPAALLRLAAGNARENLTRKLEGERDTTLILQSLQEKLGLTEPPTHIEGFDISNIHGRLSVGSMIVFQDGKPDQSHYRHFKIRWVAGSDDVAMMHEVVLRRYKRVMDEKLPLPNLILIDGGKGQLAAACHALAEVGLEGVSIIGIAKSHMKETVKGTGEKHPTGERIFLPNRKNPIILKHGSPALFLIERVRDEAHRFAITYHKKLRSKGQRHSILDDIPGIGPSRKKALLRHFGSIDEIRNATIESLAATPGITAPLAEKIRAFFQNNP